MNDNPGLRVSEATGAEALGIERGHRTLVIRRKGRKVVTIPLAPRMAWAVEPVNGRYLQCSVPPCDNLGATRARAPCLSWDAMTHFGIDLDGHRGRPR